MNIYFILTFIPGIFAAIVIFVSPRADTRTPDSGSGPTYRIMFYNAENLFDPFDDTLTADEDFTPSGKMHWTYKRYDAKLKNVYRVFVAAGIWQPPDIIGLCEIENRRILEDLNQTPFARYSYRIIHENSPDRRGIDVAVLYNPQTIRLLAIKLYRIKKLGLLSRDILYIRAKLGNDTCHFLVNHSFTFGRTARNGA
jgi:hypothetical protein